MEKNLFELPQGFRVAACSSGIKKSGKLDLALICSDQPASCAGVFTTNKVVAAPVVVTAPRVRNGECQAILVNSGNANACTGEAGLVDALRSGELTAQALGIATELVAVSSTGVIGATLPMACFEKHIPLLAESLNCGPIDAVATAIMTTDAFPKKSARMITLGNREVRILGVAKGAGMIHPDMATMLAFVLTDAAIPAELLDQSLRQAVNGSFNRITVDRDTSTNDMVLLLASGAAENAPFASDSPDAETFNQALREILLDLAKMIVRDGEGATKLVRIQVDGASSEEDALLAARSIATSALVKTAFFGEDANWGRIIAAAGYSGAEVEPDRVSIRFDNVPMVAAGLGLGPEQEILASEVLKRAEFTVTVDLGLGSGCAYYYTSDLSYDYVRINADYRT